MTIHKRTITGVLFAMLISMAGHVMAQPVISLSSPSGHAGDEVELQVQSQGLAGVTAVQMLIDMPEVLTYVDGSAVLGTMIASSSHQLQVTQTGRQLKIYVYSLQLDALKDVQGTLCSLRLLLGPVPQTYTLTPSVILSNAAGQQVTSATVTAGQVTIKGALLKLSTETVDFDRVPIGSIHRQTFSVSNAGNETLSLTAAQSSVSHLSVEGLPCTIEPQQSQELTIVYAPTLAGREQATIQIESNSVGSDNMLHVHASPYSVNALTTRCSNNADGSITVSVSMQNMDAVVAVQCGFALPEALHYIDGSAQMNSQRKGGGHQLSASSVDGQLKIYVHSPSNATIAGSDGELFSFRLQAAGASGNYQITPTEVILSNAKGENVLSDADGDQVHLSAPHIETAERLDFGEVAVGKLTQRLLEIMNTGESQLTISRVDIDQAAFSITNALPLTIEAGSSATLPVQLTPTADEAYDGMMYIYSDDPEQSVRVVRLSATATYTNVVTLQGEVGAGASDVFTLTLNLENSLPITALQADINWLPGMTTASEQVSFTARAAGHHAVITPVKAGTYRLFVYSEQNATITPGTGPLLTIKYNKVDSGLELEGTTIRAENIILSGTDERDHASVKDATLQVVKRLRGDVNGDGLVTVSDVTAIIDVLLERIPLATASPEADVNGDGQVTIGDVVETIQVILNQ